MSDAVGRPSSKEWLERVREIDPPGSAPEPRPPSRRFTRGWRLGLVAFVLLYATAGVLGHDPDRPVPVPVAAFAAVVLLVAVIGTVEAWRSAARPRFSREQLWAMSADLSPETRRTVRRMVHGRGPDVAALRPRAAAAARAEEQSLGPLCGYVALTNAGTVLQTTSGPAVLSVAIPAVVLAISLASLAYLARVRHRARVLEPVVTTSRRR